ncbi:hypothetical protein [Altericista sp. CCNU0014]|uniref:hypothetical protein n=1 Tax=Altericista sp. CCNU0014 TaxID=3082949 RepID=UPI0038512282
MTNQTYWQRWRDRKDGKVEPLLLCNCGAKLIRESTKNRGTCGACNRKATVSDRVKKHRESKMINTTDETTPVVHVYKKGWYAFRLHPEKRADMSSYQLDKYYRMMPDGTVDFNAPSYKLRREIAQAHPDGNFIL